MVSLWIRYIARFDSSTVDQGPTVRAVDENSSASEWLVGISCQKSECSSAKMSRKPKPRKYGVVCVWLSPWLSWHVRGNVPYHSRRSYFSVHGANTRPAFDYLLFAVQGYTRGVVNLDSPYPMVEVYVNPQTSLAKKMDRSFDLGESRDVSSTCFWVGHGSDVSFCPRGVTLKERPRAPALASR